MIRLDIGNQADIRVRDREAAPHQPAARRLQNRHLGAGIARRLARAARAGVVAGIDDLIADLRSLKRGLDSGTATISVLTDTPAKRRAGVAAVWRWAVVAALVVIALTTVWIIKRRGTPTADLDPHNVVVAVLENRTGDASLDPKLAAGPAKTGCRVIDLDWTNVQKTAEAPQLTCSACRLPGSFQA